MARDRDELEEELDDPVRDFIRNLASEFRKKFQNDTLNAQSAQVQTVMSIQQAAANSAEREKLSEKEFWHQARTWLRILSLDAPTKLAPAIGEAFLMASDHLLRIKFGNEPSRENSKLHEAAIEILRSNLKMREYLGEQGQKTKDPAEHKLLFTLSPYEEKVLEQYTKYHREEGQSLKQIPLENLTSLVEETCKSGVEEAEELITYFSGPATEIESRIKRGESFAGRILNEEAKFKDLNISEEERQGLYQRLLITFEEDVESHFDFEQPLNWSSRVTVDRRFREKDRHLDAELRRAGDDKELAEMTEQAKGVLRKAAEYCGIDPDNPKTKGRS